MLTRILYSLVIILSAISLLIASNIAYAEEQLLILNTLIDEALENNPQIKALKNKVDSLMARPSQEASLDDPVLKLGISNLPVDTFSFGDQEMTQKEIALEQKFPFPGKLALRREVAEKEASVTLNAYEEKKNEIVEQVKSSYLDLFFIGKSINLTEKNKKLLEDFVKIAEIKYSVGTGIQQDVIKAQIELSKILEEIITLNQKKLTAESKLNSLLNRPQGTPLGNTGEIVKTDLSFSADELMSRATEHNPLLKSFMMSIEKEESSYKLAKRDYYPDFNVEASYAQRDGGVNDAGMRVSRPDFVGLKVSLNLPLYYKNKQDKKVIETLANVSSANETYNALKNDIFFNIKNSVAEIEKDAKLISLYNSGIIPQAKQALESSISNYQVNKIDFLTLLDNQITLFNYEIEYYNALTGHEKKIAELETFVGGSLF